MNIVEILKNIPKGTRLWSPVYEVCTFVKIVDERGKEYPINCKIKDTNGNVHHILYTADGRRHVYVESIEPECVLFPSRKTEISQRSIK